MTHSTPQYPVNLELDGVACLVVGGGPVAARKAEGLLHCGAHVTVVAPAVAPELRDDPRIKWHQREYRRGEAASYRLVITATGVPAVDEQVFNDARATGIPVNAADDPSHCTFTLPAVARRGDLQITVSTNGRSPAFASWLRAQIERQLSPGTIAAFELMADVRRDLKSQGLSTERPGWHAALDDGLIELLSAGRNDEARQLLLQHLDAGARR